MSELNFSSDQTAAIDTNKEYVVADNIAKQPSVLPAIFFSIFIETPKEFFAGIFNFFARYFKHFFQGLLFFWKPSLRVPPFESKDFKEDAQRTFELALIATAILIFLIKQSVIPVDKGLQEQYGNDILQMVMELMIFVIFGTAYLVTILISIITGRVFRFLFRIPVSAKESDILFSYLNNSLFSISLLVAFIYRCGIQYEQVRGDEVFEQNVTNIYLICFLIAITIWSFRFSKFQGLTKMKKLLFLITSICLLTLFFTLVSTAVTFFILGT